MEELQSKLELALRRVVHPESGVDIVSMGLIQNVDISENVITIAILFKRKGDPLANSIVKLAGRELEKELPGYSFDFKIVQESHNHHHTEQNAPDFLKGVKNIIAVASGKGGVGKSTVSVNLALMLVQKGYKVGLLDADIYGPSIPKMLQLETEHPKVESIDGFDVIFPLEKFGLKVMSIGFLVDPDSALIWRGPMATSALKQLVGQTSWGELDFLIIDLPPGTGDIHLTMVQTLPVSGAVIVTTPQAVALADVVKGIKLFTNDKIEVPILGIVENMAWFTPVELPDNKYFIFGNSGGKKLAEQMGVKLLGQIPIVQSICDGGDLGQPAALKQNSIEAEKFSELANNFILAFDERQKTMPPTKKVEMNSK